jgi:hypothetical protein
MPTDAFDGYGPSRMFLRRTLHLQRQRGLASHTYASLLGEAGFPIGADDISAANLLAVASALEVSVLSLLGRDGVAVAGRERAAWRAGFAECRRRMLAALDGPGAGGAR